MKSIPEVLDSKFPRVTFRLRVLNSEIELGFASLVNLVPWRVGDLDRFLSDKSSGVLSALRSFCCERNVYSGNRSDIISKLDSQIPLSVVDEMLVYLECKSMISITIKNKIIYYSLTKVGFLSLASIEINSYEIIDLFIRSINDVSIRLKLEYIEPSQISDSVGGKYPLSVIKDILDGLVERGLVKQKGTRGTQRYAITLAGFRLLEDNASLVRYISMSLSYLSRSQNRQGDLIMYLEMQGIKKIFQMK